MEITLLIDPALRVARLREVDSLAAGDSCPLVLDGIPGADPATLSVALYRDASMADLVAAASPEAGVPAFSPVPGHARRFASAEPWRLDSVEMADWFVFEADRIDESSDGGGSAVPRGWTRDDRRTSAERAMRADGWLVVADASRVWAACRVPVVLRDIVGRGHLSGDSISSVVQGAVAASLDGKVDKVPGKSLSSNDFTDALRAKLERLPDGAHANVQADWDESDSTADAFVRNRPGLATESEDGLMSAVDKAKVNGLGAAFAGKADLVDGVVPLSQLPSRLDSVLEFASAALFPDEGESGRIYVAAGDNVAYRWTGTSYAPLSAAMELGSDDGEAFPGPRGAALESAVAEHVTTLARIESAISAVETAEANVQADWEESDMASDAYIRRKPDLARVATTGLYSDLDGAPALAAVATSGRYGDLDGAPDLARVATTGRYGDLDDAPELARVATTGRYDDLEGRPSADGLAVRVAPVAGRVARLVDSAVSTVASSADSASWTAWEWSSPSWTSGTDGLSQPVRDGDEWKASDPVRGIGLSAEADSESSDDMTADGGPSVLAMSGTRELRLVVTALPRTDLPAGSYTREEILASATTPATVGCVTSGGVVLWSVEIPVADLLVERASSAITGKFDVASGGFVYGAVAGLRHDGSDFTVDLDDARNSQAFTGQIVVTDQPFAAVASVSAVATRRWARAVDAIRLPEPRVDRLSRVAVMDLISDGTPVRLLDESSDSVDMPAPSEGATLYQILDTARGPSVVRLTPDRTLSVEGAPADAKAVGDALGGMMADRIEDSEGNGIRANGDVYGMVETVVVPGRWEWSYAGGDLGDDGPSVAAGYNQDGIVLDPSAGSPSLAVLESDGTTPYEGPEGMAASVSSVSASGSGYSVAYNYPGGAFTLLAVWQASSTVLAPGKVGELAHRSELVRADWDESDSGDLSFIRNKPLPDTTLSMPGAFADAGAVGDALGPITADVAGLDGRVETVETTLASKANAATTLAGYGITDAKIENGTITLGGSTITPITQIPTATSGSLGAVRPDGTTITVVDGVISVVGGGGGGGLWAGGNLTFNLAIWNSYPEDATGFLLLVKSDGSTQRVTWSGSAPSSGPYPNVCLAWLFITGGLGGGGINFGARITFSTGTASWTEYLPDGGSSGTNIPGSESANPRCFVLDSDATLSVVIATSCLVAGTMIRLSDGGARPVENISYDDELAVWDFDSGRMTSAKPCWIKKPQHVGHAWRNRFSDGTEVWTTGTVAGHRFFSLDAGRFLYNTDCVGHRVYKIDGKVVKLESATLEHGDYEFYNLITARHGNCFANGVLAGYRYCNLYPIAGMKYVKDGRRLRSPGDYPSVSKEMFDGCRLAEVQDSPEDVVRYIIDTKESVRL